MSTTAPKRTRRPPQVQLDMRALEAALEVKARQAAHEEIIRLEIKGVDTKIDTQASTNAANHIENKAELAWIKRALWTAALGLIGLLLAYILTRIH